MRLLLRLALAMVALAPPVSAQRDSVLREAVRLVTEGRGDSARALVRGRLRAVPPTDSLHAEALYTAGLVASHPDSALSYFRRVSLDHSQSSWADQALLRLAQLAFAAGDYAAAQRAGDRILTDYPLSDIRAAAAFWVGRTHLELGNLAQACRALLEASAAAGSDVELANQVGFYLNRCAGLSATPPATADSVSAPPPATGPRFYAVQVAAVQNAAAADQIMRRLKAAGHEPRVIRDADGLLKVRVGRFAARGDADTLARSIREMLGGQPFVVDEQ